MSVFMCVSSSTKSSVDSYLCMYVIEALSEVLKKGTPQNVFVFVHVRSRVGMGMYVCMSVIFTLQETAIFVYACACMLTPLKDCNYISYFTINYEVLCIKRFHILIQLHNATLSISSLPIATHKDHPQESGHTH